MKKTILAVAVALFAIPALPAAAQSEESYPSYIQVNGRAEEEIVPDEFYLSIVIDERESKGRQTLEQQRRDMIASLKRAGVDVEKQLKVADMSSEYFRRRTSAATAQYQLLLHSGAEVTRAYEALDAAGIQNVSILRVSHSKLDEHKERIRLDAVRNARANAASLAEAIGQRIGSCFYIYDSNNDVAPIYYNNNLLRTKAASTMYDTAEGAAEESLDFKTIRLNYSVQAKFVLLP